MKVLLLSLVYITSFLGSSARSSRNDLICYQCQGQNPSECNDPRYLKQCPDDQAYDRCETITEKKGPNSNITVTKKCSLAPCAFDIKAVQSLTQRCDTSKPSFHCSNCCKENACNSAPGIIDSHIFFILFLLLPLFVSRCSSSFSS